MPLYVLALTDTAFEKQTAGRPILHSLDLGGFYAICERRRAAPALDDERLREQHGLVLEIASAVRAILPVRFGALMDKRELVTFARDHDAEIRLGLDDVRDRVQMTIRIVGRRPPAPAARTGTGREYLNQRRRAVSPVLPPAARTLLSALRPLVARERQEPGAGRLLATVYHLIDAGDSPRYRRIVKHLATPAILVTGPWPPFAFTPQLG
ncbi:MAG TPA: GvpL/GvpF family gas vesicle protein [Vicinamibacterales bacterium]|nr:GvpL/GvpF family gas vesicle protein [Vicinamibacterales bacterium]